MFRIKEIIESKNETVKNIAGKLGIAPPNLSNIINGRVAPSLEMLQRIANALDVHITELFDRDNQDFKMICPHCGGSINLEIKKD